MAKACHGWLWPVQRQGGSIGESRTMMARAGEPETDPGYTNLRPITQPSGRSSFRTGRQPGESGIAAATCGRGRGPGRVPASTHRPEPFPRKTGPLSTDEMCDLRPSCARCSSSAPLRNVTCRDPPFPCRDRRIQMRWEPSGGTTTFGAVDQTTDTEPPVHRGMIADLSPLPCHKGNTTHVCHKPQYLLQ